MSFPKGRERSMHLMDNKSRLETVTVEEIGQKLERMNFLACHDL